MHQIPKKPIKFLSIKTKPNIIGGASDNSLKYINDIDINENCDFKDTETAKMYVYNLFLYKFQKAQNDPNLFITNFKCGLNSDYEPLKWDITNMIKGWQLLKNGNKIFFIDALTQKSTIKMDIVYLDKHIYKEFAEIYFLSFGEKSNWFKHDLSKPHILTELQRDENFYENSGNNLYKALKREYSILKLNLTKNKSKIKILQRFFNSDIGKLYNQKTNYEVLLLLMENERFKKSYLLKTALLSKTFINNHTKKEIFDFLINQIEIIMNDINQKTNSFMILHSFG